MHGTGSGRVLNALCPEDALYSWHINTFTSIDSPERRYPEFLLGDKNFFNIHGGPWHLSLC